MDDWNNHRGTNCTLTFLYEIFKRLERVLKGSTVNKCKGDNSRNDVCLGWYHF